MWTFPHYTPGSAPDWDALINRFAWLADMAGVPQDPNGTAKATY